MLVADPLETFAANLRERRLARHLTQEELAHRSGLHMTDVGRIERGERDPGVRTIVKLAAGLGVGAAELFAGLDD